MSVALIPPSAPFDVQQRAWLNGFLAGWIGLQTNQGEPVAGDAGTPDVAYSTGSAGAASHADHPAASATAEEDFPWHDPSLPIDDRLALAEGKPVERRMMAAMAQLDCGSCGYDCRRYAEALARGEEKNLSLCSPGGKETSKALKRLAKEATGAPPADGEAKRAAGVILTERSSNAPATNGRTAPAPRPGGFDRERPYPAKVLRIENLNRQGSSKRTSHVELCLEGSDLAYKPGDALGVWPTNCEELVRAIVGAAGIDRDAAVTTAAGETMSALEALTRRCDLKTASEDLVELTIASTSDRAAADRLRSLQADDELDDADVLDVLLSAPRGRLDAQAFVSSLDPLRPRLYSIASSLAAYPNQVHLTIGRVEQELRGRVRKGVASTMFADRLAVGSIVEIFLQPSHGFALPADPSTPIAMVGPGTGIAPFRAFLSERRATGSSGKNWLFFGDQRRTCDFLYEDELTGWLAEGSLTRLDLAFSRDQDRKVYVQDRMRENGRELFRWLEEGASFYVCGDAARMARDVDQALKEIVAAEGGMSADASRRYVADLAAAGRYSRDVY